jgi:curved DNA-binding protein CbpA
MLDTARYYRVLDLEPGASPEEIHQGYIDLTWVWHPDRFAGHPRLQEKAHHKLQEINEAHAQLRSLQTTHRKGDFRTTSKSHVSPPSPTQSHTDSVYQWPVDQTKRVNDQKTVKDCKPCASANSRNLDAWLD